MKDRQHHDQIQKNNVHKTLVQIRFNRNRRLPIKVQLMEKHNSLTLIQKKRD